MANTANVAVTGDKAAPKGAAEKTDKAGQKAGDKVTDKIIDKVLEKRRALGRGLESLLPGPRIVQPAPALSVPAEERPVQASASSAAEVRQPEVAVAAPVHTADAKPDTAEISVAKATAASLPLTSPLTMTGSAMPASATPASGTIAELMASASGKEAGREVVWLEVGLIDSNPHQTRRQFDEAALEELAESILVQGLLQPIVVRPGKDGRFTLILGERRLRACLRAEIETIPAVVRRVSEQQAAEMTVVENLQRQDLNCVDQAAAFDHLSKEFKLTQEQIGARVGVSRETVSNYMRLLVLPEGVIGALQKGRLTYSHARALLQLRDNVHIWKLAQKVMEEKLSVAKLEHLVLATIAPMGTGESKKETAPRLDPNVLAAQRSLEAVLGVRVRIRDRNGKGKVVIEYSSLEDFDRVVEMLRGRTQS